MKKSFLLFLMSVFLFTGCGFLEGDSIKEIKEMCKEKGKNFKVEKRFNFRIGEYEKTATCY